MVKSTTALTLSDGILTVTLLTTETNINSGPGGGPTTPIAPSTSFVYL